jgi:FMN reductase (NADPH)
LNSTIETILSHRSVRKFKKKPLTNEQIEAIVRCAQSASTSSFIQAYTIIGVTDMDKKQKLAELSGGQSYVAENGHFFVFCADLYRHQVIGEIEGGDVIPSLESTEKFMVTLVDTALAAQNAAIAAESMGLGICYIGGIRNHLEEVKTLLQIPERVIPLFGMAVGYPDQETAQKPRLPLRHVYQENVYNSDKEKIKKDLEEYNKVVTNYYKERTGGVRQDTWTGQMSNMLSKRVRMYMKDFVEKQKMDLR